MQREIVPRSSRRHGTHRLWRLMCHTGEGKVCMLRPARWCCVLALWSVADRDGVRSSGCEKMLSGWRARCCGAWQDCRVGAWIVDGDPRRRLGSRGVQVFVICGLVAVCRIAVDILLVLECVSFLLVATTWVSRQTLSSKSGSGSTPPTRVKSKKLENSLSSLAASDAVVGRSCMLSGRLMFGVGCGRAVRRRWVLSSSASLCRWVFPSPWCCGTPFMPFDGDIRNALGKQCLFTDVLM